jgi:hypothetical protein
VSDLTCTIDGCDKPIRARGWCSLHYGRWNRNGDPLVVFPNGRPFEKGRKTNPDTCERDGCTEPARAKGLCKSHWGKDYRKANLPRITERNKAYETANPEMRKGISARQHQKNKPAANARSRARKVANPDESMRYWHAAQAKSVATADRSGFIWAGWEMELLNDPSRTSPELAAQLGRTMAAVALMRHKIRHDPQSIERAGLSADGTL